MRKQLAPNPGSARSIWAVPHSPWGETEARPHLPPQSELGGWCVPGGAGGECTRVSHHGVPHVSCLLPRLHALPTGRAALPLPHGTCGVAGSAPYCGSRGGAGVPKPCGVGFCPIARCPGPTGRLPAPQCPVFCLCHGSCPTVQRSVGRGSCSMAQPPTGCHPTSHSTPQDATLPHRPAPHRMLSHPTAQHHPAPRHRVPPCSLPPCPMAQHPTGCHPTLP